MDAFRDRLSQRARDTGRPDLAHQCRGRPLSAGEEALASAMMEIYASGEAGFAALARGLTERGIIAPNSGRADWDEALLAAELAAINAGLDAAYEAEGYGA